MDQVIAHPHPPLVPLRPWTEEDELAARRSLRAQIAKLERALAEALADARPGEFPPPGAPRLRGPRLLGLGELEHVRDALAGRLADDRSRVAERAEREEEKRLLLERMLLDPGHFRWARVYRSELGEPGCGAYHVRPRLGLIGMLAGWWQVKLSSGCPLSRAPLTRSVLAGRLPDPVGRS